MLLGTLVSISYTLGEKPYKLRVFIMCGNNYLVPNVESSSLLDIVPVPPTTKTFAYNKYYLYGSAKEIEIEELKGYELEVVSVDELVSYILNDIHATYDKEKDSSKNGHVLQAVVVFVVNQNSCDESDESDENDEPRETASSQITLYQIDREKTTVINTELIESACSDVFYDDEYDLVSSDED